LTRNEKIRWMQEGMPMNRVAFATSPLPEHISIDFTGNPAAPDPASRADQRSTGWTRCS
jgi:hypothetical protein